MYKVTFPTMPALNEYLQITRSRYGYSAKTKRNWTRLCADCFINQFNKDIKLEYPYEFVFVWYCKNKRKDPDNISFAHKFIFDGMQIAGFMKNDNWAHITDISDFYLIDKENPHVDMFIIKPNEFKNIREDILKKELKR